MPLPPDSFLDRVLHELEVQTRPEQFETWFRGFSLGQQTATEVEFRVPSGFVRDWLHRNYLEQIQQAVDRALTEAGESTRQARIVMDSSLVVDATTQHDGLEAAPEILDSMQLEASATTAGGVTTSETKATRNQRFLAETQLNEDYTFEQFVVGPSNQLSHAASLAVGQNPGRAYNPLFIHGNVGLGKTHLLQSISHAVRNRGAASRVVYLSCEEFTNRYILAIQSHKLDEFREFYRSADVLVIDDVQFLAGKEKTQEEFFHTFNALYNTQKQIVFSSDRSPADIPTIQDRLVSRFKWGLVTDIQQPCFETRLAIVQRKALMREVEMTDDVARFVAERVTTNIREVEGAVIKVIGVAAITERPITLSLAEEALHGVTATRPNQIGIPDVISMITSEFSVSAKDLTGKSRTQKISLPRQIGMYLSREYTDHSLEEVGRYFGNRDHTTVLYAVTKIKKRSKSDRLFRELLTKLSTRLETGGFSTSEGV